MPLTDWENKQIESKDSIKNNIALWPEKQKFYDVVSKNDKIKAKTKENIRKILEKLAK
jgi:hypothetical protein